MGFRSMGTKFESFENENIPDFEAALQESLGLLEDKGMCGDNKEPEVTIVLRNTVPGSGGTRLVNATVFIGATTQDVAMELNKKI